MNDNVSFTTTIDGNINAGALIKRNDNASNWVLGYGFKNDDVEQPFWSVEGVQRDHYDGEPPEGIFESMSKPLFAMKDERLPDDPYKKRFERDDTYGIALHDADTDEYMVAFVDDRVRAHQDHPTDPDAKVKVTGTIVEIYKSGPEIDPRVVIEGDTGKTLTLDPRDLREIIEREANEYNWVILGE